MSGNTENDFLSALSNPLGQDSGNPTDQIASTGEDSQDLLEDQKPTPNVGQPIAGDIGLGKSLLMQSFHPVLIFGTRATGKTTFLTSMLAFFRSMPKLGVTVTLGQQLSESEAGALAHESAEKLFHLQVNSFINGTAPELNQDAFPFFVPLELRKLKLKSIIKIALMESSGELWDVKKHKNQVLKLRAEIIDIYKNYTKPLSVIMMVPYAMRDGYTGADNSLEEKAEFQTSDASLLQTLQIYQQNRRAGIKDQFYFVLTKWDMHTQEITTQEFVRPSEELVSDMVEKRFPQAYNFFRAMSHGQGGAKCLPYSAGLIGGTTILEIPHKLRPLLLAFPHRLWRWIYSNATDGGELDGVGDRPRGGPIAKFFRELFT